VSGAQSAAQLERHQPARRGSHLAHGQPGVVLDSSHFSGERGTDLEKSYDRISLMAG
jgi:hypothetical protein